MNISKTVIALMALLVLMAWGYSASWLFVYDQKLALTPNPWDILNFWRLYGMSEDVSQSLWFASVSPLVIMVLLIILALKPKVKAIFGEARFARKDEAKADGLFDYQSDGVLVGKWGKQFVSIGGPTHILLSAPTRGGKGVGFVIPNLVNWNGSTIVIDIKKENWTLTAGYRQAHGHACYLFDPGDASSQTHAYNPMSILDPHCEELIGEIQKIAKFVCPESDSDPMWGIEGQNLFTAVVLCCMGREEIPTLSSVYQQLLTLSIDTLQKTVKDPTTPTYAKQLFNAYLMMGDKQQGGVLSTITSRLQLYASPIVARATSKSDFDLSKLRKTPMSLYIGVTPDNLMRFAPLISLLVQQAIDLNTRVLPENDPDLKVKCLFMLDEFPALGRLSIFIKGSGFFAGYGLKIAAIIQNTAQLSDPNLYGQDGLKALTGNMATRIAYAPNLYSDAELLSKELGMITAEQESTSQSMSGGGHTLFGSSSKSINTSGTQRALMLPDEILKLPRDSLIIMREGKAPIKTKKIIYYTDQRLKNRVFNPKTHAGIPPPVIAPITGYQDTVHQMPEINAYTEGDEEECTLVITDLSPDPQAVHGSVENVQELISKLADDSHTEEAEPLPVETPEVTQVLALFFGSESDSSSDDGSASGTQSESQSDQGSVSQWLAANTLDNESD